MNQQPMCTYVMDDTLFDAMPLDEVEATFADLQSLGLAEPPSLPCLVKYRPCKFVENDIGRARATNALGWDSFLVFRQDGRLRLQEVETCIDWGSSVGVDSNLRRAMPGAVFARLVCALAARNVEKVEKVKKLAKLGIGKRKGADARTITVRVPQALTEGAATGGGSPCRAHFRRGHIRRQRYGAGRAQVKQIWVQPVFVNADETFVPPQALTYTVTA